MAITPTSQKNNYLAQAFARRQLATLAHNSWRFQDVLYGWRQVGFALRPAFLRKAGQIADKEPLQYPDKMSIYTLFDRFDELSKRSATFLFLKPDGAGGRRKITGRIGVGSHLLVILSLLCTLSAIHLPAQTEAPDKERELTLTPSASGGKSWADSIAMASLRFFEKGREDLPPDQRQYQTEFDQSATRYVAWDLTLEHPPVSQPRSFTVEAVFYGPEGEEIGRLEEQAHCEPGASLSSHTRGWGWPEPGFWAEGAYRVAFLVEGRPVGEGSFSIVRTSVGLSREEWLRELRFDYLRFYEKGRESVPYGSRVYRNWFPKQSTRYVAWELHLKHPAMPQPMDINLQAIYYFPDGRVFGRDEIKTWVDPGWPTSWHTSGWGWPDAGYWQPGIYRVEFYLEGQRLATDYFEIR